MERYNRRQAAIHWPCGA